LARSQHDNTVLRLEMDHMKSLYEQYKERQAMELKRSVRDSKMKELQTLRQIVEGFDEERQIMEVKYGEIAKLLQQAVQDIVFLSNRNSELEKQLLEARNA
jgi:protein subunit release factor B